MTTRYDAKGFRTDFALDLIEKVRGTMKKTGVWMESTGVNYTSTATEMQGMMEEKLANKTLKVATVTQAPYVMEKIFEEEYSDEQKNRMPFLDRYEGFCIDLVTVGRAGVKIWLLSFPAFLV